MFNFSGTGTSQATDADPTHYEVAAGNVILSWLGKVSPVRVLRFATRFKTGPPDFTGQTVMNLSGAWAWHPIWRSPVATDLLGFGISLTVVPEDANRGFFAFGSDGGVEVFT